MNDFMIGQNVIVEPFGKEGVVRSKSTDPHGTTLFGVVFTGGDKERHLKRVKGAMDVYVPARRLVSVDSVVIIEDAPTHKMGCDSRRGLECNCPVGFTINEEES